MKGEDEADGEEEKRELFISNLPWSVDEDTLRSRFEQYGDITKVKLLMRPDGKPKGIAFIEYESHKDAKKGLVENG
jgi:RNA recognition motif-containing protein